VTLIGVFAIMGGISATAMWVPQFVALLRTGDTKGLSVPFWIVYIGTSVGWIAHGVRLGQAFIVVANVVAVIAVATSLVYLWRDHKICSWLWLAPGFLFGALLIGLDGAVGSAAFGIAVVTPVAFGMVLQGVQLMRDPEVSGVSIGAWVAQLANQVIWAVWSTLCLEPGTMISAYVSGVVATFVLGWRLARQWGVGPVLRRGATADCSSTR